LLVIGDGTQRPELHELMAELAGAVTHQPYCEAPAQLAQIYRAADLFVHPGVQETFGLVSLEAQACGTPVVGIRGSYMDRIIQNGVAHWAAANSPGALADAIRSFPKSDTQHLHDRIARRYSWAQVFARLFDLYREVIREFHHHR
jgi:alpha-1,6-mannosyltransferase